MDRFKFLDHAKFNLDKYDGNSFKGCVSEVDIEYPKELHQLHNGYPLAQDKLEIKKKKKEISDDQLNIANDYNISIDNVKN